MKTRNLILCLLTLSALWAQKKVYPERWVYAGSRLASDRDLTEFEALVRTASEHGLNGVLFASNFDALDLQGPEYVTRLKQAKAICDRYHLDFVPPLFSTGYGGGILKHDKNLAEGVLAKDALFIVKGGEARFSPEASASFTNGGFENGLTGYESIEKASIDSEVAHTGKSSLRLEGWGGKADDTAHVVQAVSVKPYRQYRLSCWVKSEGVKPAILFGIHADTQDGRSLHPWEPRINGASGWKQLISGFNSSSAGKFRLDIGVFEIEKGAAGKVWVDDLKIEEVGLLNVVRRGGTPVTVSDEKTGALYQEGKDYAAVADPQLNFRWNHDSPAIAILAGGGIKDGARLRVSYYHGTTIYQDQVPICLSEPKTYDIWKRQARLVHDLLAPRRYMMSMDELRMGGSCETCKRRKLTMAEIVGDATTRQFEMLRELDPKAEVFVWSDMYDPNHNARDKYYLVEGDLTGSWNYIPKDLKIVCWYFEKRGPSLEFFSKLGFQTLAAAYYDADNLDNVKGWLEALDQTPGALGIMYTTWQHKFKLLAPFGDLVSHR